MNILRYSKKIEIRYLFKEITLYHRYKMSGSNRTQTPLSSLYNISNSEFGVYPRNTYAEALNVRFYLKHFRSSTVDYILDETGWDSITQYEDMARRFDMFPCTISPNGFFTSSLPNVDPNCFRVFELSLHHLKADVLERIMRFYIGMNLTDYELQYPEYNNIHLAVPYFSWINGCASSNYQTDSCNACDHTSCTFNETTFETSSNSETDDSEVELYPSKLNSPALTGWRFKFNTETNSSYILYPKQRVYTVGDGNAFWGDSCTPTTWKLMLKGLNRPLYYSSKYKGWPISLDLKEALLNQGVIEE